MLTYFSNLMLGMAARAAELVLDADARLVMPAHWRLDWTMGRVRAERRTTGVASSLG